MRLDSLSLEVELLKQGDGSPGSHTCEDSEWSGQAGGGRKGSVSARWRYEWRGPHCASDGHTGAKRPGRPALCLRLRGVGREQRWGAEAKGGGLAWQPDMGLDCTVSLGVT